ncbi:unnamed protein product [Cuscuta epithymum]|uniref:Uncharacterized protein n=1 Tax=Cuscuta epithymum TaxID=186058 RepID=A0AAV0CQM2_9ASTE|nr:unnamed protein product [Cuscuta epithymum]
MDAGKKETTVDAPVQIPKAIPYMPFPPPPECIKVDEDLSLSLVPRLKFNYTLGCMGSIVRPVDVSNVKIIVSNGIRGCYVFPKPLTIPFHDIHVHIVSPFKWTVTDEGKERWVLADGHFFYRDERLVSEEFRLGLRNCLLKDHGTYKVKYMGAPYQVELTLPSEEDPDQMMASLSSIPADNQESPTIIMNGLPRWFTDQPASVHIFLEALGVVRKGWWRACVLSTMFSRGRDNCP